MTTKTKPKRVILEPKNPPDSFDRGEMRKIINKVVTARRRKKQSVHNGSK